MRAKMIIMRVMCHKYECSTSQLKHAAVPAIAQRLIISEVFAAPVLQLFSASSHLEAQ